MGIPKGVRVKEMFDNRELDQQVLLIFDGAGHYYQYGEVETPTFYEPDREGSGDLWFKVIEGHVVAKVINSAENGDPARAKYAYIIDNEMGPEFDRQVHDKEPRFTEGHIWYRYEVDGKEYYFVDGVVSPPYDRTWGASITSSHVTYAVQDGQHGYIVRDGAPLEHYNGVGWYHEKSGHFWYQAMQSGGELINFDGKETRLWDSIYGSGYEDGHFWYVASQDGLWYCVIDGEIGPPQADPSHLHPIFCGERYCYRGIDSNLCESVVTSQGVVSFGPAVEVWDLKFLCGQLIFIARERGCDVLYVDGVRQEETFTPKSLWVQEKGGEVLYGGKVRRVLPLTPSEE